MTATGGSYTLTGGAIKQLRAMIKKMTPYPALPPRVFERRRYSLGGIALRCRVVGIDITTWGANRKKLAVQRLKTHPYGFDTTILYADGWIDSPIVCGQEVICLRTQRVEGDPEDSPSLVAIPIFAVDQANLDEPDPTVTVHVVDPALPLNPTQPCAAA